MLNRKEIISIFVITILLGFSITLLESMEIFFYACLSVLIIIMINTAAKKISSFYLESEIEVGMWEIKRYGFKAYKHFKKPLPAGAFFPLISKIFLFPFNNFVWMASLVFDVKPKVYRAAKRHGLYKFSEMTEYHIGLIAASGIAANILLAIIGYLINFPLFAKLNIYYALFNLIPVSELDGNKIFFGSFVLWSFLASIVLIGMLLIILIV
jgi:Zn-dependent protease